MNIASRAGFELRRRPSHYAEGADQFLRSLIREDNPVVLDVGANEGQSVRRFRKIWSGPTIHCFEPHPEAFATLLARHSDWGLHLNQIALSSARGVAELNDISHRTDLSSLEPFNDQSDWFSARSQGRTSHSSNVTTDTLDHYWEGFQVAIDLLKIDTQGHESSVLKGAECVLQNSDWRPKAIELEINIGNAYARRTSLWEVDKPLSSFGYFAAYLKKPFNLLADPQEQIDVIYVHRDVL
jgi:FkbM family methyltransferase